MNGSTSNIKTLCDEYLTPSINDEQLIKVLTKILTIVKISEKFQKELFIHLSDKGINKLLNSLKDNNEDIRKLSCKMILDMLYNNEVLQNIFCEKFNFNPVGNVICFNWIPKYLKENIKIDERVINEIKNSQNIPGSQSKYWLWPANAKYTDEVVPDPQKYFIGFYSATKNQSFSLNVENTTSEERLDTKVQTTKLDSDFLLEDDKPVYVAAGSGSESSSKIKEKYIATEPISIETSILRKQENNNVKGNNNKPDTVTVNNNPSHQINSYEKQKSYNPGTKVAETKVVKDDYKKGAKEKYYSRSIDANIASKVKNMNTNIIPNLIPHTNNTLAGNTNNIHLNNETTMSKLRITKAKK